MVAALICYDNEANATRFVCCIYLTSARNDWLERGMKMGTESETNAEKVADVGKSPDSGKGPDGDYRLYHKLKIIAILLGIVIAFLFAVMLFGLVRDRWGQAGAAPKNEADSEYDTKKTEENDGAQNEDLENKEQSESETSEPELWESLPADIPNDNVRNYYEIYVASFYDSDGDGIGDLKGIEMKLDDISDMGFTGIWLMPIMPSPTYHKYDVTDYMSVDPDYGNVDDFSALAKACEQHNIRLIIDLVMNHTSSSHPWFLNATEYLRTLPDGALPDPNECPYVDYYHFSKEKADGTYYPVKGADWYYEGAFWSEMPDLNWDNEAVLGEMLRIEDYWMGLGADGFRLDAVKHFEAQDRERNKEIIATLFEHGVSSNPDFYMVSEVWSSGEEIRDYYESGTPSFFNFPMSSAEGILEKCARGQAGTAERLVDQLISLEEQYGDANPEYIDAPFLTNHDMARVANNLQSDPVALKMAAACLLSMKGSPFVYYGEEIGMKSKGEKDENKRIAMKWSDEQAEGMCDDPEGADRGIESAFPGWEEQRTDPDSLLNTYRKLLHLRNSYPEIGRGMSHKVAEVSDEYTAGLIREWEDRKIGILYHVGEEPLSIDLTGTAFSGMELCGEVCAEGGSCRMENGRIELPPRTVCYLK